MPEVDRCLPCRTGTEDRAHRGGGRQVLDGDIHLAEFGRGQPPAELRVVVVRADVRQLREALHGPLVQAAVEVGAGQRLKGGGPEWSDVK